METNEDGSKESSEKDKENEGRKQSGAASKYSRPSDAGTRNLSMDSVPSLSHCPVPQNSPESQLEGEDHKEPEGLTAKRYKYDRTLEDHEELSKNLRESAMRTMIKMLELQAARRTNGQGTSSSNTSKLQLQPPNELAASSKSQLSASRHPSAGSGSAKEFETRLQDMEKQVKQADTRISESKREQAHLMSLINNLEVKMYRTEEADYIKDIMGKVPSESDLEKMKRLQLVMVERKRLERDTQRLQMEIRAMNNAMANADVIVSESSPIKKPRRVVIRETPDVTDDPSAQISITTDFTSYGRPERRGHITSPEPPQESSEATGQDDEEGRKRSVESDDEGEVNQSEVNNEDNESEVKATPPTKGKKAKKK